MISFIQETTDGWDDFDIDEGSESITKVSAEKDTSVPKSENTTKTDASIINTEKGASNDSGWTDFDDWGDTDPPKTGKVSILFKSSHILISDNIQIK